MLHFAARIPSHAYNRHYAMTRLDPRSRHNAACPDRFVLERLEALVPAYFKTVWDIGAGDGRNTLPILRLGFSAVASEINPFGRECIQQFVREAGLTALATIDGYNILDPLPNKRRNTVTAAVMVHTTQHWSPEELAFALAQVHKALQARGLVMMDILVLPATKAKPGLVSGKHHEKEGSAFYQETALNDLLVKAGFRVVEQSPYQEAAGTERLYTLNLDPQRIEHRWLVLQKQG